MGCELCSNTIGTYDGSWGTKYRACREKAVPLHRFSKETRIILIRTTFAPRT